MPSWRSKNRMVADWLAKVRIKEETAGTEDEQVEHAEAGTVTPAAVSDQDNTSTGYFDLPSGNDSARPEAPSIGMLRFNTAKGCSEQYTNTGWNTIASPPVISGVTPTLENQNDDPQQFTISGSNFTSELTVQFTGADGMVKTPDTQSSTGSSVSLTFAGVNRLSYTNDPYTVKVINNTLLEADAATPIYLNTVPQWSTGSGLLGTVDMGGSVSLSLSASDADGDAITYSLVSGSLPSGVSLNSSGAISGTAGSITSDTTYNFTIGASDSRGNAVNRAFSIKVKLPLDGSSAAQAAPNAKYIKDNYGVTTSGLYWIKPRNDSRSAIQVYCDMSYSGGGWMLIYNGQLSGGYHNRISGTPSSFTGTVNSTGHNRLSADATWLNNLHHNHGENTEMLVRAANSSGGGQNYAFTTGNVLTSLTNLTRNYSGCNASGASIGGGYYWHCGGSSCYGSYHIGLANTSDVHANSNQHWGHWHRGGVNAGCYKFTSSIIQETEWNARFWYYIR